MNNNHVQGQPGRHRDANLYGYGAAQDDFSTPFTNDGPTQHSGFTDPTSFMNSNFDTHFDQQMATDPHDALSNDFFPQNAQPSWQQPTQFFEPQQLGSYHGLSEPASNQGFATPYNGGQLANFADVHDSSSFSNFPSQPSFGNGSRQQDSVTINPHAIQTPADYVYQQPPISQVNEATVPANYPQKLATASKPAPTLQQQQPQLIQQQPAQQGGPQRRFLDTDLVQALDNAIPPAEKQGWLSIRPRSQFKSPAEVQDLPSFPFINISKEAFDSAEARVIPPPRRVFWSVNQLEQKLRSSPLGGRDSKTKSLLESKVLKARTRIRPSKPHKQRKIIPAAGSLSVGTGKAVTSQIVEVSDEDSSLDASDEESDYVSDSDEVIEEEPSPLPPSRPEDPAKGREYDALKAVWARSAVRIGPDDVKRRLASFLDVIKKIRTEWRAASSPTDVAAKRKEFEHIMRLTVKHGHHNFIESIDQLTPLASIIAAAAVEIIKGNLYTEGLLEAILELVVKIPNIDPEFLKTTKLDKHKERIIKKTQGRIKDLAGFIETPTEAAAAAAAAAAAPVKQVETLNAKSKPTTGASVAPAMARAGSAQSLVSRNLAEQSTLVTKKPLVSTVDAKKGVIGTLPVKRPLVTASGKPAPLVANAAKGTNTVKPASSKAGEKPVVAPSNGTAAKTTIRQVASAKAPSIFSTLTAPKKAGVSATTAVKSATSKPKTPEQKAAVVPPPKKPSFSFSDVLANVGKPKEEPKKTEAKEQRAPETEEERKKRLRKEERRKLRVTWRPDHELEAVRIFDHGQDDEAEHDAMDVADAADLKSEGQAFKRQLRRDNVPGMEPDDEEEQEFIDWRQPDLTDFAEIYERKAGDMDHPPQNVETRANGPVKFSSVEGTLQQKREQGAMIELYATSRDIPPYPKEPSDPFNGKTLAQYDFGPIKDCGTKPHVAARLEDRNQQLLRQYGHQSNTAAIVASQPSADVSSILAMLGQGQSTQQPQQQYQPAPAQAADPYSALLAQLNGPQAQTSVQQPATNQYSDVISLFNSMQTVHQTPAPMPSMTQTSQPQQVSGGNSDLTSILASLAGGQSQTPVPVTPTPPPPQPQAQPEGLPGGIDPSLLGWLTQYNSGNTGNTAVPQPQQAANSQASWSSFGNTGATQAASGNDWLQQFTGLNSQSNGAQNNGNDRKRGYDDDNKSEAAGKKKQKKIPFTGTPFLVCRYYKEGRCQKGTDCTFLHE